MTLLSVPKLELNGAIDADARPPSGKDSDWFWSVEVKFENDTGKLAVWVSVSVWLWAVEATAVTRNTATAAE